MFESAFLIIHSRDQLSCCREQGIPAVWNGLFLLLSPGRGGSLLVTRGSPSSPSAPWRGRREQEPEMEAARSWELGASAEGFNSK